MEQVSELAGSVAVIEASVAAFDLLKRLGQVWKDYNDPVASSTGLYHHCTHSALVEPSVAAISEEKHCTQLVRPARVAFPDPAVAVRVSV